MFKLKEHFRPKNGLDVVVGVAMVLTITTFVSASWDISETLFVTIGLITLLLPILGLAVVSRYETEVVYEELKQYVKLAVVAYLLGLFTVLTNGEYTGGLGEMGLQWATAIAAMFVTLWAVTACGTVYAMRMFNEWRGGGKGDEEILEEVLDDDE